MDNLFSSTEQLQKWQAVADGEPADWDELFRGHQSTVDWPGTLYWRELVDAYPAAKVLLTGRPAESWWQSFSTTIYELIEKRHSIEDDHLRATLQYAHQIIALQTFGGLMHDRDAAIDVYQRRIDEVARRVPADRLLIFDLTEGWEPLCGFLESPVPEGEFPHCNNREDFWRHFGAGAG